MKKKFMDAMSNFAKSMVQPLMYVSVIGIVMLLGIVLTNAGLVKTLPFLSWGPLPFIGKMIYNCLMFLINNLSLLFCIGIAGAMAKSSRQHACLIATMVYFVFLNANNLTLAETGRLAEMTALGLMGTGQTTVFGIQVLDMGVFSGIILGCLVGWVFNKLSGKQFKGYFQMFSGVRFPFLIMLLAAMVLGWGATFVWPYIQAVISALTGFMAGSGNFGLFLYGVLNKLLLPFGLHHLVYTPFMFSEIGGTLQLGEQLLQGAYAVRTGEVAAGLPLSDATYWMSFTFINLFGYIGVAMAFLKTALPENKEKVKAMLVPLTITVVISSITEPFDFLFCFAAPALYAVLAVISGLSMVALKVFNLPVATSGGLINVILGNLVAGYERTHWPFMFILGAVVIVVTYFIFVFLIQKFNFKTPGREAAEPEAAPVLPSQRIPSPSDVPAETIVEGLGGKDNILSVDNCFTRLRVSLKDSALVKDDVLNTTGCSGIVKKGNDIQVIYGMQVGAVRKAVEEKLDI